MPSYVEKRYIRVTPVSPACGAFTRGNRFLDHLGKVTLAADRPSGWDGRFDYHPNSKLRAERPANPGKSRASQCSLTWLWPTRGKPWSRKRVRPQRRNV
jgi:hypothetical protein